MQRRKCLLIAASVALFIMLLPMEVAVVNDSPSSATVRIGVAFADQRKAHSLGKKVFKILGKIEQAIYAQDLSLALELIDRGLKLRRLNDYEIYILKLFQAKAYEDRGDIEATLHAYKEALAASRRLIPEELEIELLYDISRFLFSHGRYEEAMTFLQLWAPRNKKVDLPEYAYIAQVNYMVGQFAFAARSMSLVLQAYPEREAVKPRQQWYDVVASSYWELGDFGSAITVLASKLSVWPSEAETICPLMIGALKMHEVIDDLSAVSQVQNSLPACADVGRSAILKKIILVTPEPRKLDTGQDVGICAPIVTVQPRYPRKARKRGVEGYVIVRMHAQENGWVDPDSIEIIEEEPGGTFSDTAVSAASKFRYPSKLNGVTECRKGLIYRFDFDLNGEES